VNRAETVRSPPRPRWLSALELLLGAAIVVGHNVLKVLPNEVPILFVLGLTSIAARDRSFTAIGLRWPPSWRRVAVIAVIAAAARILLGEFVIDPLTHRWWPPAAAPAMAAKIPHDAHAALLALGLVWTFAAIGEEVGYRGYLMTRAADLFGRSKAGWWISALIVAVLFGFGHYYKGPAGIVDSGVAGLILAAAYLASGRVLLTAILAHGLIDSFGVAMLYFGLAD
jgi:membrane protease YdiL (CAAX protease family)